MESFFLIRKSKKSNVHGDFFSLAIIAKFGKRYPRSFLGGCHEQRCQHSRGASQDSEPEDHWDRAGRVALAIMDGLGSLYQDYPGIRLGEQESDEHIRLTFDRAGYIYTYTIDVNEYSFKEKVTPPYYARR